MTVAVTLANWPQLAGLPGTEFRYPQDWYQKDWSSAGLQANRRFLGETAAVNVNNGQTVIVGPITWKMADIPTPNTWHPCLLADVRGDNNDTAGGPDGRDIDADPDPCSFGSYFWGNNNACQRNLTYNVVPQKSEWRVVFPFVVGSVWSKARFLEVIVEKGPHLVDVPMTLYAEPVHLGPKRSSENGELVFLERSRVIVRTKGGEIAEMVAAPGTVWKPGSPERESCIGALKVGDRWHLTKPQAAVGFPTPIGQLWRMTLAFISPATTGRGSYVRVLQRNDHHVITGSVQLELKSARSKSKRSPER